MTEKIAERLRWAVDILDVQPNDHILEIGCGAGIAVALVCERLVNGTITTIDRSDAQIRMASKRNHACMAAGKAVFQTAALDEADFGDARFNKIFAVNVNLFWLGPGRELEILHHLLSPDGALYLVYQPPDSNRAQEIADKCSAYLQQSRFSVDRVLSEDLPMGQVVCIIAKAV